jgi:hypothetical protein
VSGLPGSGKTTLGQGLAPLLNLPLFDKDGFLEELFAREGIRECISRGQLSRKADVSLQCAVDASRGAVVVSFWHIDGMSGDSGTPTAWLHPLSRTVVNVHCTCSPELAATRFVHRHRHPGHGDRARSFTEVLADIQALPCRPLGVGELVTVDTDNPVDLQGVLTSVEAAFLRYEGRCRS